MDEIVSSQQGIINQMAADMAGQEAEIERLREKVAGLQSIAADLNRENVRLKQTIARLQAGPGKAATE